MSRPTLQIGGNMTKKIVCVCLGIAALVVTTSAQGFEMKPFRIKDDFGSEPLSDCTLQYYYYIPCPTYSWFWAFAMGCPGDMLGVFYEIGDVSMQTGLACDPEQCHSLERIRVLDFAGYGVFTVRFDVYCSDELGCPVGPRLWTSGPYETARSWNYVEVEPALCITQCCPEPSMPASSPRILIVSIMTGTEGIYPAWGLDNISTPIEHGGCEMHDTSCLPALYPRPHNSHYPTLHTGYYGCGSFEYCPPLGFIDGRDTTDDFSQFGGIEAAWRIYLSCSGPTSAEPTTWGAIKSMYR
jgi:hypothetical protein